MTGTNPDGIPADGIDPDDLETCLRVLDRAAALGEDHPDSIRVQRSVGHMFKLLKKARRAEVRRARQEADKAVIEATATGSPTRIDDETAGIRLVSNTPGAVAGHLQRCLLYTSPSPRDLSTSRMPSSA